MVINMKIISDDSAISEVMALLMLVLVAVSASAAYYTWISNLQEEVQTTGSEVAETRLNTFMSEIEVVCYLEYVYYNTDSNSDGEIAANATLDERFIQEIQVLVINKALFNLTNVKVKVVSFGNESLDWAALHFYHSTRRLQDREGSVYHPFTNDSLYFKSESETNTSIKYITDEGYPCFALNNSDSSAVAVNTTNLTDLTPLHNPTYKMDDISKGEVGTGYVYLLINRTALPADTALKLYITNDQGVDAYRTIQFSIQ
jgi:flagellin-like protein